MENFQYSVYSFSTLCYRIDLYQLYFLMLLFYFFISDMPASGLSSGNEIHNYIARDDDRTGHRMLKDTKTIGTAYDRYLQSGVTLHLAVLS